MGKNRIFGGNFAPSTHIFWIAIWCSAVNNSSSEYLKLLKLLKQVASKVLLNECLLEWDQL